jgi:hypothetical protein
VNEVAPFSFDDQPGPAAAGVQLEDERSPELTAAQLRRLMISEFRDWLLTRTSRDKRPFQPDTIAAYADAAIALDAWMSAEGIETEFTGCDTAMLNRFFADLGPEHQASSMIRLVAAENATPATHRHHLVHAGKPQRAPRPAAGRPGRVPYGFAPLPRPVRAYPTAQRESRPVISKTRRAWRCGERRVTRLSPASMCRACTKACTADESRNATRAKSIISRSGSLRMTSPRHSREGAGGSDIDRAVNSHDGHAAIPFVTHRQTTRDLSHLHAFFQAPAARTAGQGSQEYGSALHRGVPIGPGGCGSAATAAGGTGHAYPRGPGIT